MRLRINGVNLSGQLRTIIGLIEGCYRSLIELDLSWCSLTLDNVGALFGGLTRMGWDDADCNHVGVVHG